MLEFTLVALHFSNGEITSEVNIRSRTVGIWRYHVGDRYTRHDAVPWNPEP